MIGNKSLMLGLYRRVMNCFVCGHISSESFGGWSGGDTYIF